MPVRYQLFAQDHSGDHNLEREFVNRASAMQQFRYIRDGGGYWAEEDRYEVFVPWHRIDFIRVTKIEIEDKKE